MTGQTEKGVVPAMQLPGSLRRRVVWSRLDYLCGVARPALAWGRMGHRASARLAESRLSPQARAIIRDLLEPGESLADASTWADEESLEVGRRAYLIPGTNKSLRTGDSLGHDYEIANLPLVTNRIARSGVRLASLLNEILK